MSELTKLLFKLFFNLVFKQLYFYRNCMYLLFKGLVLFLSCKIKYCNSKQPALLKYVLRSLHMALVFHLPILYL